MNITTKEQILDILQMPKEVYRQEIMPKARQVYAENNDNAVRVAAMLGYSNVCKNQCLYCGMRAGNTQIERYRIEAKEIIVLGKNAWELGLRRIFLISGEDPLYRFEEILAFVSALNEMGFFISLAAGEYHRQQYEELKAAGVDEYVMKFEMSNEAEFNRLNPSTNFKKRMQAIEEVKQSGMHLASGNIVGYPGQSLNDIAEDILLMKKLNISWAPVIPYLPAAGTPLAKEGARGDLTTNLKEISILRLMMPAINITAAQPGEDMKKGLSDVEGNFNALKAGANLFFVDMLPAAMAKNFSVIDDRLMQGLEHVYKLAEMAEMQVKL